MIDELRLRIRSRLKELRISAREASRRAGFNVGYVGDFLEGRSKDPGADALARLASALDMSPVDLFVGTASNQQTKSQDLPAQGQSRLLPLYAAPMTIDKAFANLSTEPVGFVPTLPALEHVAGAYAVVAFNDWSAPRYFIGETLYVSPAAMVRIGDFVFGRLTSGESGFGRLASMDGDSVTCEFIARGESMRHARAAFTFLHRIIGSVAVN